MTKKYGMDDDAVLSYLGSVTEMVSGLHGELIVAATSERDASSQEALHAATANCVAVLDSLSATCVTLRCLRGSLRLLNGENQS